MFFSTRLGNVLDSHGAVFSLFRRRIAGGGPVTLTDSDMTCFVMSTREAMSMVSDTKELAAIMIDRRAPLYGRRSEDIPVKIIDP
ncbi:polysaccharide biosynthesis protein [uncultured Desulfovibrio sp.]|uniref:polysaccharide biosynthesis protein n=1 Tax=uncultured Desulfovibrio sp. TaxID=167968 RepID=UPI0025C5C1EC|nr:polysaccharide biosynthesis protein [Desulfovibrio sp.]